MADNGEREALDRVPSAVVRAIQDLISEFAYRVDFENGMTVPELFSPDAYYESDGRRSTGREAIRAMYRKRAALGPRTARHMFTNVRIEKLNEREYAGTSLMLLFAENGNPPHPAEPLLLADVADRYKMSETGVLLESRTLTSIFVRPGSSPVIPLGEDGDQGSVPSDDGLAPGTAVSGEAADFIGSRPQ